LRKLHQKTLAELLATLKEANAELAKPENSAFVGELIKSIKEFTEVIINYISANVSAENEDKGTAINALEIYTEKLSADTDKPDFDSLSEQLYIIEIEINKFRVTQFEIVFIVSSAAKADSLLPVYEIAAADPACIARWMPVPIYKINEKREIIGKSFDGPDKYPGIDCTDFITYNFAQMRPDVIVINDIFDNNNLVSELPKMFWTFNLKKFTECLVYIPYFVFGTNLREDDFVRDAGLEAPDLVFVESKLVKDYYITANKPVYEDNFNYNKFIALGSPKFDSAIYANERFKNGELKIPDDWREKIYRNDGSKKAVVFFNTSLQKLLGDVKEDDPSYIPGSGYIERIKSTIKKLSDNNNVLILWRPHPLLIDSVKSMRPWLLESILEIVENFKNSNVGIYDESGDMYNAIAVSDCYICDGSSIGQLFTVLNKNLLDQDLEIDRNLENLLEVYKYPRSFFKINKSIFEINCNNHIIKFNNKANKFDFYREIPEVSEKYSFYSVEVKNEDVWFFPFNSNKIAKYHYETDSFDFYELKLQKKYISPIGTNNSNFFQGIFWKNKVFLVPCCYRAIVCYNFDTGKTEHCFDLREYFPIGDKHILLYSYEWLNENTVLIPSTYTNEVFEFCLETYEVKIHKLGREDRFFNTIQKYKNDYFLVGRQPFIAKWNYETGEFVYYDNLPKGFKVLKKFDWTWYVNHIKPCNGKLILFGGFTSMALEFDLDSCLYKQIESIDTVNPGKENKDAFYSTSTFTDNEILYFVRRNETFCSYNIETGNFEEICEFKTNYPYYMIGIYNNDFFEKLICKNTENNKIMIKPCAEKIYKYIKKQAIL
jgi:hypothetical protein